MTTTTTMSDRAISPAGLRSTPEFGDIPEQYVPSQKHHELRQEELLAALADPASARRTKVVGMKMMKEAKTDFGGEIDSCVAAH